MKALLILLLCFGFVFSMPLGLSSSVTAQGETPLELNMNLGVDPITLDPALTAPWDTPSITVIEQLFIGLVDLDDESWEIKPELATSWTISPDGTVYTFNLRNDVYWTDGQPVTAQDVRYGMLRSLDPSTDGNVALALFMIKNAEAYHSGHITDPNQVGITVIDPTTLRVTLEHQASYAPSVFSRWIARPMPQWAIEAWGPGWTDPAHIVTNGPYRLTEWVQGEHLLLDKNPAYYDSANVQIERVKMWMLDHNTAWTMYQNGQLDTAGVPAGAALDPILSQEVRFQSSGSTYFYGFNVSQPPFDNPLVRKAFIAAANRAGLIRDVMGGMQQPALTLSPPGVFGYVDGYAERVGVPYSPNQARQWLADAGYPNGEDLPPVTLWFNTSPWHQAIAEYIRDSWYSTLGVSVTLQSLEWEDYLGQLEGGGFQVWRLGWIMDYPDAYNFLHDVVAYCRIPFGGWENSTYEDLLQQAARTQDPATRRALYKQMERILVDTDLVVLPLYYDRSLVAAKPYLERTFTASGTFDIATWRLTRVSSTASPEAGGEQESFGGDTTIGIPAGAITETITITHSPAYGVPPASNKTTIGNVFDITAVYSSTGQPAQLVPGQTYSLTVRYTEADKDSAIEETLALHYWDGSEWVKEDSSVLDMDAKTVSANPAHFSRWALLGDTLRVYLPLLLNNY